MPKQHRRISKSCRNFRQQQIWFSVEPLEQRLLLAANILEFTPGSASSQSSYYGELNNLMIIGHAGDSSVGHELHASNGTAAGTSLLADIRPGTDGSSLASLGTAGNQLVFVASPAADQWELWATDGTAAGTNSFHTFSQANAGGTAEKVATVGDHTFFRTRPTNGQWVLWATDGTAGGTEAVYTSPSSGFSESNFVELDNRLIWIATPNDTDRQLWSSDGSVAGTQKLLDLGRGDFKLHDAGTRAFVHMIQWFDQGDGREDVETRIVATNGTGAGTQVVFNEMVESDLNNATVSDYGQIVFSATEYSHQISRFDNTTYVRKHERELLLSSGGGGATQVAVNDDPSDYGFESFTARGEANGIFYYSVGSNETYSTNGTQNGTYNLGIGRVERIFEMDGYTILGTEGETELSRGRHIDVENFYTTTDGQSLKKVYTARLIDSHVVANNKLWVSERGFSLRWTEIDADSASDFVPWQPITDSLGSISTITADDGKSYFFASGNNDQLGLYSLGDNVFSAIPIVESSSDQLEIVGFYQNRVVVSAATAANGAELYIDQPTRTMGVANDFLFVSGTSGDDVISVFSAPNTLEISAVVNGVRTDYEGLKGIAIDGGRGNDRITLGGSLPFAASIDGGQGDDFVLATIHNDTIRGGLGKDFILTLNGRDHADGGANDDRIFAAGGGDIINGGSGNDFLIGGVGTDTIRGGSGHDFIHGFWANDRLSGGFGNDEIIGGTGADDIFGEGGNDTISGNSGNDELRGGDGDDLIFGGLDPDFIEGERGNDMLYGMAGLDVINGGRGDDFINGGGGNDSLRGTSGDDEIFGGDGDDRIEGDAGPAQNFDANNRPGNDTIDGGLGADQIWGNDGDDVIRGQGGNDVLYAGNGDDLIYGGGGDDRIWVLADEGLNRFYGGDGNDRIDGGPARDYLFGGAGEDVIHGFGGHDVIEGGADEDTLFGDDGIDTIRGGAGNDWIDGGFGNNKLFGDEGNDYLRAYSGHDLFEGGLGHDVLVSGFGNDTLRGNAGDDVLLSGGGQDLVFGGTGSDFIVSEVFDEAGVGSRYISLAAIWTEDLPLATRRLALLNGTSRAFPYAFAFGERSRIDGFSDTIYGGDGVDIVLAEADQFKDAQSVDEWLLP